MHRRWHRSPSPSWVLSRCGFDRSRLKVIEYKRERERERETFSNAEKLKYARRSDRQKSWLQQAKPLSVGYVVVLVGCAKWLPQEVWARRFCPVRAVLTFLWPKWISSKLWWNCNSKVGVRQPAAAAQCICSSCNLQKQCLYSVTRGSAIGWGTALQSGMSRVRFPLGIFEICYWGSYPGRCMTLGWT